MKNVLITGSKGFIGKNLVLALGRDPDLVIIDVDIDTPEEELWYGLEVADVIFHLAGINRSGRDEEFVTGNVGSLSTALERLAERQRCPLIILSSSAQALLDNPYGRSKRRAEEVLLAHAGETQTPVRIFRLPGVFGKWCRPDYNSVVATFCHNIAHGLPIRVDDPAREIEIVHVGDVVNAFAKLVNADVAGAEYVDVQPTFQVTLGALASALEMFRDTRKKLKQPDLSDPLLRRLYATYMSYLPPAGFAYPLDVKIDSRGGLAELFKTEGHGQMFISRTKPGVTRGNHYHDAKVEKFIVLEGEAIIRFRHMVTGENAEYPVSGEDFRVVDIPPGWTHSIENAGQTEMIVLFWSSEVFDPDHPDTHPAEVLE